MAFVRWRIRWAAVVVAVGLLGGRVAQAKTVYVSTTGNDTSNGLTWAAAKKTVQAGLNAAASGDQVWVKVGTYVGCITLKAGVGLYGGFAGNETGLSQRDWTMNVTVLDGNQAGSVVTTPSGGTATTQIDGFTIRNGKALQGGGIYCYSSSPTIRNNTIVGNTATSAGGGGIYCGGGSSTGTITSCTITGNTATNNNGGGIYCDQSTPVVTNNSITANNASGYGGGIACGYSSAVIAHNWIAGNTSDEGGGISCTYFSPVILDNTITANNAWGGGGGIYCENASASVTNNRILGNSAVVGAGICFYPSGSTVANNVIAGNSAKSQGGGIYSYNGSPKVVSSSIVGNSASDGGGIYCCYNYGLTLANTIVAWNSSGICWVSGSGTLTLRYDCVYGNTAYDYSGLADPTGTNGNISTDPQLVRPPSPGLDGTWSVPADPDDDYGNVRLLPGSPCIDAGSNTDLPADAADLNGNGNKTEQLPLDLDGNPRVTAGRVDIGAYEVYSNTDGRLYVTSITPDTGLNNGPASITYLAGGNFLPGATVVLRKSGQADIHASNVTVVNSTRITCTFGLSAAALGGWDVVVTDPDGQTASLAASFTVMSPPTPIMHSISPDNGQNTGTVQIINLAGWNFEPGATVVLRKSGQGDIHGTSVTVVNPVQITCTFDLLGAAAGAWDVIVTNPDGLYGQLAGGFIVPKIVYVAPAGNDANNGLTWTKAKQTVQAGIDAAIARDQVWVAAGRYVGCVSLKDGVGLYGGFAGTETDLSQRNWTTNVTILDGNNRGSVVTVVAGPAGWQRIDGLTIRNGYAYSSGGGICCSGAYTAIVNNVISGNTACGQSGYDSARKPAYGGGIYCNGTSPTIAHNKITDNKAFDTLEAYGGGILCGSGLIANNEIIRNTATGAGRWALMAGTAVWAQGESCAGGVWGSGTLMNNLIAGNRTICSGVSGHPQMYGGASTAGAEFFGTVANNVIVGNVSEGQGTGAYGSYAAILGHGTWVNNVIAYNSNVPTGTGDSGVAMINYLSDPMINTIIAFNSSGMDARGEPLRCNCVYGNAAGNYPSGNDPTGANGNISEDPLFVRPASPGPDGVWGTADDDYGDLRLLPGSPCIDAGSNADVPTDVADLDGDGNVTEPLPLDLAGNPRFVDDPTTPDTGSGTVPIVDIGAYERQHLAGDVNGNWQVDVVDLLYFLDAFGSVTGDATFDARCDFNGDGSVDVVDLLILVENFGR